MFVKNHQPAFLTFLIKDSFKPHLSKCFSTIHARMCFYEVLGINSSASPADIKKAYYAKAKEHHPDHNPSPSTEETFKIISQAYEILKDPNSRRQYDESKSSGGPTMGSSSYSSSSNSSSYSGFSSSSARAGSRAYYRSHYNNSSYDSTYSHQKAWDEYNRQREEQEAKKRRHTEQAESSTDSSDSLLDNIWVRCCIVIGLVVVFDTWRKTKTQENLGVMSGESLANLPSYTPIENAISKDVIKEEMRKKQFRIEYHSTPVIVSSEAREAIKTYKKEKKIIGLDKFVESHNLEMHKSEDRFARGF